MNDQDLAKVDDLITGRPNAPERIYFWRDTQLSIARFYGGINIHGVAYTIDETDPGMPLIRAGVKTHEQRRKDEQAVKNRADRANAIEAQGDLI